MYKLFLFLSLNHLDLYNLGLIQYGSIKTVPLGDEYQFIATEEWSFRNDLNLMRQCGEIHKFLKEKKYTGKVIVLLNGVMEESVFKNLGPIEGLEINILFRKQVIFLN